MKRINDTQWVLGIAALLLLAAGGFYLWQGPAYSIAASAGNTADTGKIIGEPIQPIPLHIDLNPAKVALGKRLFDERMFSANNTISCSSCHVLATGGVDHQKYAIGINGLVNTINTPTVYNSGFSFRQFWDGRAATLDAQVAGPIHNPVEMGSNWADVVKRLGATPAYVSAFGAIYPNGITPDNIEDSIATFERSLYTPNSRFDQYLRGNTYALTADEIAGYTLFKSYGCSSCHQGVNVGGNMYQRLGIVADYFGDRGGQLKSDFGLFNVTGKEEDRFVFKVPSLRMAVLTAPYFHDGSIATLPDAVKAMAHYQLGRNISDEDVNLIIAFLKTLPGDNPELTEHQ